MAASRSGRSLTERERDSEAIKLRLRGNFKARLLAAAEAEGLSASEWVELQVDQYERAHRG